MLIEPTKTTTFRIVGAPGLDPINVVLREVEPNTGELIVTCYGLAWTAYWGAMPNGGLARFVVGASADYIANRMWIAHERRVKARYAYLVRIVEAVQRAIAEISERPQRGKPCPCDAALGGSIPCYVKSGGRLGGGWYCRQASNQPTASHAQIQLTAEEIEAQSRRIE